MTAKCVEEYFHKHVMQKDLQIQEYIIQGYISMLSTQLCNHDLNMFICSICVALFCKF